LFQGASVGFLMQIYKLTTYHKLFFKALPLLIVYSLAGGYLLYFFELDRFFIWYLVITIILLLSSFNQQHKAAKQLLSLLSDDKKEVLSKSLGGTKKFYILSSVIHLFCFSFIYLYFYNA